MAEERLKWAGQSLAYGLVAFLAWKQVVGGHPLPQWSMWAVLGAVAFVSILQFPYTKNEDGSPRRLIKLLVRGRSNASLVSGDQSTVTGNVVTTGKGNVVIVVTPADARQISNDTGRSELLPETRPITMPDARAVVEQTLNRRVGELTDMLLNRINESDPGLFARFADPRFLGPLGTAHRAYAEMGNEELGATLSEMLSDLAAQPVGSRREIFLRQAIEVTRILTIEHINSLAVKVFISYITFGDPYDTDMLIRSLDTLLSPYYGRIPTSRFDYQYMSSTGVCESGQLGSFASGPYQVLYEKYRNSMYPALRYADLKENLLREDNPHRAENEQLLVVYVESEDDVVISDQRANVPIDAARFRVAQDHVATILSSRAGAEQQLTEPEKELRAMVLARTLSLDQFKTRIAELRPELAALLDTVERTGALEFPIQPVGFVLTQHETRSRTPQLAAQIDVLYDDA
jgi:hypothetical protein